LPKNSNSDLLHEYGHVGPTNASRANVGRNRRAV
jgi:hypothetical protein